MPRGSKRKSDDIDLVLPTPLGMKIPGAEPLLQALSQGIKGPNQQGTQGPKKRGRPPKARPVGGVATFGVPVDA